MAEEQLASLKAGGLTMVVTEQNPRRLGARRSRLRPREWDGLLRRTHARVPRARGRP